MRLLRKCRRCSSVTVCQPYDTVLKRRVWLCAECIEIVKKLIMRVQYHGEK